MYTPSQKEDKQNKEKKDKKKEETEVKKENIEHAGRTKMKAPQKLQTGLAIEVVDSSPEKT